MGKLRAEPKERKVTNERYQEVVSILKEAQSLVLDSHLFYDLDRNEDASRIKKEFLHVAEKEGISLKVKRSRGSHSLQLLFGESIPAKKMRAMDVRDLILETLGDTPMKKSEVLAKTGISISSWNLRVKELVNEGLVKRMGQRRDTVYTRA